MYSSSDKILQHIHWSSGGFPHDNIHKLYGRKWLLAGTPTVCLIMDLITTSKMYFKLSQAKVKAFAQSNLYYSIVTSLTAVFLISISKHPMSAVALDSKAEILLHFNF